MTGRARIVIAGGPRVGKSTFARHIARIYGCPLRHTDDLIPLGWSAASEEASRWLDLPGPWIVEGVAMARALRKWLARVPRPETPCDVLYWRDRHFGVLDEGQRRMAKGCATVMVEIRDELFARGLRIEGWDP